MKCQISLNFEHLLHVTHKKVSLIGRLHAIFRRYFFSVSFTSDFNFEYWSLILRQGPKSLFNALQHPTKAAAASCHLPQRHIHTCYAAVFSVLFYSIKMKEQLEKWGKQEQVLQLRRGMFFRAGLHRQRLSLEVGVNVTFLKVTVKIQCP